MVYLVIAGMAIDVLSLMLVAHRVLRGSGPSPVPVVGLVLYWVAALYSELPLLMGSWWMDGLVLSLFHLMCQYSVPLIAAVGGMHPPVE